MKFVLASSSPRRAEILRAAGFSFDVLPPDIVEVRAPGESATDYVLRLADEKARATAAKFSSTQPSTEAIIIAADTTVVANGKLLEKPQSPAEAREMLEHLSGGWHDIHTGAVLLRLPDGATRRFCAVTRVEFANLDSSEISDYVASGEPFGKAGGYAIQGIGGKFVKRIEGCYFNVMGLPLSRIYEEIRHLE